MKKAVFSLVLVMAAVFASNASAETFVRPLSVGSSGSDVSTLQQILKDKKFFTYPEITGYFGSFTYKAVADFQKSLGFEAVGSVGPLTRSALNTFLASSNTTPTTPTIPNTPPAPLVPFTPTFNPGPGYTPGYGGGGPVTPTAPILDTTAPSISTISSGTPTTTSATITWTTDESATSQVNFGTSTLYGTASTSVAFTSSHSIVLTGLTASTTYHYVVVSADAQGNTATSSDQTFLTPMYDLAKWGEAKMAVAAGTRNATLLTVGDSTTAGNGAGTGGTGVINAKVNSYPNQLAALMASTSVQSFIGTNAEGANLASYDPRFSIPAAWTESGVGTLGYGALNNSTDTSTLALTPSSAFDTIDIWWLRNTSLGTFTVNVDGGATLATISEAGASGYIKTTITVPLDTHTININRVSGSVFPASVIVYNSATKVINVLNAGMSGKRAVGLTDSSPGYTAYKATALMQPDLTIINMTINDWIAGTDPTTFQSQIQGYITQAKLSGDVILMSGAPTDPGIVSAATQEIYRDIYDSLSRTNEVNYIDLTDRWGGSYSSAVALGFMFDDRHPNAAGYADAAAAILPYLLR